MVGLDRLKASDNTGQAALAHITSTRAIGATVIDVDSVDNWPTNFIVTTGTLLGTGLIDPSTITEMYGHVNAGDIVIDGFMPGNTDSGNSIGQVAVIKPSTGFADWLIETLRVQHKDNGTHGDITADSLWGTTQANILAGWITPSGTWTYASATTVTVNAADYAAVEVGTKVKLTQTTAKYFYVTAKSGGNTLTLTGGTDYTLANAAITSPLYSNAASPVGHPIWFSYVNGTAPWTAATTNPAIGNGTIAARFSMEGRIVRCNVTILLGSTSTVGSGVYRFILPVPTTSNANYTGGGWLIRQGTAYFPATATTGGKVVIGTAEVLNTTYFNVIYTAGVMSHNSNAWASTDMFCLSLQYEV